MPMPESEKELRWSIFRSLLPYYGKLATPEFLQKAKSCIFVNSLIVIEDKIKSVIPRFACQGEALAETGSWNPVLFIAQASL